MHEIQNGRRRRKKHPEKRSWKAIGTAAVKHAAAGRGKRQRKTKLDDKELSVVIARRRKSNKQVSKNKRKEFALIAISNRYCLTPAVADNFSVVCLATAII